MSNLKTIFSSIFVGLLVLAGSLYAASPTTPPACDTALYPGCNLPINVSGTNQIKTAGLGLGGKLTMVSGQIIDFNSTAGTRVAEGQIGYASSLLNIYGGGTSPNRKVVIYDQICSSPTNCKPVADIITGGGGTSGVSQITAGTNVTISPTTGTGNVTVNARMQTKTVSSSFGCVSTVAGGGWCSGASPACGTGWTVVGGGCDSNFDWGMGGTLRNSYPASNRWNCYYDFYNRGTTPGGGIGPGTRGNAYAICLSQ